MSGEAEVWPVVTLGSLLLDMQPGFASGKHNSRGEGVPHLRPMNVSVDGRIDRTVVKYVDPAAGRSDLRLRYGDVLFNNTNSPELVGKSALFEDEDAPAFSNHMTRLRVDPSRLDAGYLAARLHQTWREGWFADHCNNHVSQASIGREVLRILPIELPPIEVQRAAAMLSSAVDSRRASAATHLERARQLVDTFRAALLAEAYLEASSSGEGNGEGTLASFLREPLRNGYSARPVNDVTPFRVLTLTATTSGRFDPRQFKYTDEEFAADSPFWLAPGDVVVQRGNTAEFVGVPAIYDGEEHQFLYPDLMIRVRVRSDINPRFVWYMLLAPQSRTFLRDRATGSAGNMPKINQTILADVPMPIPSMEVRDRIVDELDTGFALADAFAQRIGVASRLVGRTSHAIISKVFRGELGESTAGV